MKLFFLASIIKCQSSVQKLKTFIVPVERCQHSIDRGPKHKKAPVFQL